ncbi:MAG: deoxyhypusine synthase [Phycisphaerae bacterium]|jgi:deoxyhypusine synthase
MSVHDTHCSARPGGSKSEGFTTDGLALIDPLVLEGNEAVADLIDRVYARSGYNARRLAEACELYSRMLREDTTVCLTLAGAMTPIGMSGVINALIRAGFIDCIISTGANLYHDLHRPFAMPVMQGHFAVDDNVLAEEGVARIYDVFIEDQATLLATDQVILQAAGRIDRQGPLSTARLHHALGGQIKSMARRPEWSILVTAFECDVPVYTSSPGDSSIAMNLAVPHFFGEAIQLDPLRDVIETAAIVRAAGKNGVIVVGGGSPKNFYLQTQPTLHQIFHDQTPVGHDYMIQLAVDSPQWGGLSGATPQEARSWGKIRDAKVNNVVVYSCASLTLPLLAQYVRARNEPRPLKRLYRRLGELSEALRRAAENNPEVRKSMALFGNEGPGGR